MFKVNKNTRTTSMTFSSIFIVKFEQISHPFLVFLLLTLNKQMLAGWCFKILLSSVNFLSYNLIVSATRRRRDIKIPFCLSAPVRKSLVQKKIKTRCKLKFGTQINSNMQNSLVMFTFSVFDWKYLFCANLVKKMKIVSLR